MPSITVPSPGITSPASTTTTAPRVSCDAGFSVPSWRPRQRSRSAWRAGWRPGRGRLRRALRPIREGHGQPQPQRDGEREPRRLAAAAERLAAEELDQPRGGRDRRAELDHEHDRVAGARVELAQRTDGRRARGSAGRRVSASAAARSGSRRVGRGGSHDEARRSRARLSSSTFTPGSPSTPRKRPSVWSAISPRTRASGAGGRPRPGGPGSRRSPRRWSTPDAELVGRVGHAARGRVVGRSRADSSRDWP